MPLDPYAPPRSSIAADAALGPAGLCPRCHSSDLKQPRYTWWGGWLGPSLFKHSVCRACGFGFNRETGLGNRRKIIVYVAVSTAIVLVLFAVWTSGQGPHH